MSLHHSPRESDRLAALWLFNVLDTPPEPEFDGLTRLAAAVCGTPIALVSLGDPCRQWFQSRFGLTATETPQNISFCTHAIAQDDLFVVPDAAADERFADDPLVTGEPHIRFYAGMPLATPDGHNLGTLCVIDRVPRTISVEQQDALRVLAGQVVAQLALRRQIEGMNTVVAQKAKVEADLRASEDRFRAFMDHCPAVAYMKDELGRIIYVNEPLIRRFGLADGEWLGKNDYDFFPPEFADEYLAHDRQVMAGDGRR